MLSPSATVQLQPWEVFESGSFLYCFRTSLWKAKPMRLSISWLRMDLGSGLHAVQPQTSTTTHSLSPSVSQNSDHSTALFPLSTLTTWAPAGDHATALIEELKGKAGVSLQESWIPQQHLALEWNTIILLLPIKKPPSFSALKRLGLLVSLREVQFIQNILNALY